MAKSKTKSKKVKENKSGKKKANKKKSQKEKVSSVSSSKEKKVVKKETKNKIYNGEEYYLKEIKQTETGLMYEWRSIKGNKNLSEFK